MATFTTRLKDEEAEALTRLAYLHGVSKNRLLSALIAAEYEKIINGDELTPPDEELLTISDAELLPAEYGHGISDPDNPSRDESRRLARCYKYAADHRSRAGSQN